MTFVIVAESVSFSCSFEKDASCLLTDELETTDEIWDIVDGRGVVADNTLNNGRCTYSLIIIYTI